MSKGNSQTTYKVYKSKAVVATSTYTLDPQTVVVRLIANNPFYFAENRAATTDDTLVAGGVSEYFGVDGSAVLNFLSQSTAATINVSEMSN